MKINSSLSTAAKKATSIITIASMLSSMVNLGLMLPAKAQLNPGYTEAESWAGGGAYLSVPTGGVGYTLDNVQSFINSPSPSGCQTAGICDEYTNISYVIKTSDDLVIDDLFGFIKIATNIQGNSEEVRERWNTTWIADTMANNGALLADNVVVTGLPAGVTLTSVDLTDGNFDQSINTLELELTCDMQTYPIGCLITGGTEITIDLKNNPLIKPNVAGPVMQNVIVGKYYNAGSNNTPSIKPTGEAKMTINSYYGGLEVSASVDARLVFAVSSYDISQLPPVNSQEYVQSSNSGCDLGTLVPNIRYECIWKLNGSTNAVGGMQIYVVQDHNMTYPGSGAEIKQFKDGTLTESAAPETWSDPTGQSAGGANAHLAYTSNDQEVFGTVNGEQVYAGISDMSGSGEVATTGYGSLVGDSYEAGDLEVLYGIALMTSAQLEQAIASANQFYGHTQYFIVVGNF